MNFTPKIPTAAEFLAQIRQLCNDYPDNVNPNADGSITCVYDKDGCHCIIGQWLKVFHSYDFVEDPLGTYLNEGAGELLQPLFGAEIANLAADIQVIADVTNTLWKDILPALDRIEAANLAS